MEEEKKQVILYTTNTCNKCHFIKPHLEKLVAQYEGIQFREISIEENPLAFEQSGVTIAPTVAFYKCESETGRLEDIKSLDEYRTLTEDLFNNNDE